MCIKRVIKLATYQDLAKTSLWVSHWTEKERPEEEQLQNDLEQKLVLIIEKNLSIKRTPKGILVQYQTPLRVHAFYADCANIHVRICNKGIQTL